LRCFVVEPPLICLSVVEILTPVHSIIRTLAIQDLTLLPSWETASLGCLLQS
jgi:hypothetical protein